MAKQNKQTGAMSFFTQVFTFTKLLKDERKIRWFFLYEYLCYHTSARILFGGGLDIVTHVETCFQHLIIIPITKPSSCHGLIITTTYYLISRFNKYLQQEYIISVFSFCFHSINLVVQKILMFISYVHGCNIIYLFS